MTLRIERSGRVKFQIVGALPTWLQNAVTAAPGTGLTSGLPLYQWYKLANHAAAANGRPNIYWSKNPWGSEPGFTAPGTINPDVDYRADPNLPGFQWNHQNWDPDGAPTIGHFQPVTDPGVTTPNVTNYVSRVMDSAYTFKRSGSVVLLHGAGHTASWCNDVAEVHFGDNNLLRQAIVPPTPYDMIRYCQQPSGQSTHPKHYTGANMGWDLTTNGADRFHNTHYLDGRPVAGHCGFRNMYIDELDVMVTMGTGVMNPGAGSSGHVEAWRWSTKDWDKPAGYVSSTNTGPGNPLYGEVVGWPVKSGGSTWPGAPNIEFPQPLVKLIGENKVIMPAYALAGTSANLWSYVFPGPGFTKIGTMSGMNAVSFSGNQYPSELMAYDPVRNRVLMVSNYIYRRNIGLGAIPPPPAGVDWRIQEGEYQYARVGYLDLNLPDGSNYYVKIPQATYDANPALRFCTPGDPYCYDENRDRYLFLSMKLMRDPRSDGFGGGIGSVTYYGQGGLYPGMMSFNRLFSVNPSTFELNEEITVKPDPVYGVPPGLMRGRWRQFTYLPELRICVYFSDAGDRINPTHASTSTSAYGAAGGHYFWIMRVG